MVFDIRNYFFSVFKNANANQCGSQTRFELGPKRALDSGDENRFFPFSQASFFPRDSEIVVSSGMRVESLASVAQWSDEDVFRFDKTGRTKE